MPGLIAESIFAEIPRSIPGNVSGGISRRTFVGTRGEMPEIFEGEYPRGSSAAISEEISS